MNETRSSALRHVRLPFQSFFDTARTFEFLPTTVGKGEENKYCKSDGLLLSEQNNFGRGGKYSEFEKAICKRRLLDNQLSTAKVGNQVEKRGKKLDIKHIDEKQQGTPRIIDPVEYDTIEELLDACEIWWVRRYRKNVNTWIDYRRKLENMFDHQVYPVDPFNISSDQVVAQFDFIEDEWRNKPGNENLDEGSYAVINKFKAIKALMRAFGKISEVEDWNYIPPPAPDAKPRNIPPPKIVHNMMHYNYSTDPYEKRLYQYMITFGYMIGPRPSSELSTMKVTDFDEDEGMFTFWQPKVERWREVPLEDELSFLSNRKSLKNWIDIWRPKVETSESEDFLFIQPNGRPFTEAFMAKKLREQATKVWPKFSPYSMRHWAATARLIKSKVRSGSFDIYEVCEYMDHSGISITKGYTKQAGKKYRLHQYDWIDALLKFHSKTINKIGEQQKGVKKINDYKRAKSQSRQTVKRQKRPIPFEIPSRTEYGPAEI